MINLINLESEILNYAYAPDGGSFCIQIKCNDTIINVIYDGKIGSKTRGTYSYFINDEIPLAVDVKEFNKKIKSIVEDLLIKNYCFDNFNLPMAI